MAGKTFALKTQFDALTNTLKDLNSTNAKLVKRTDVMGVIMKAVGDAFNIKFSMSGFSKNVQAIKVLTKAFRAERRGDRYTPKGEKGAYAYNKIGRINKKRFDKIPLTKGQKFTKGLGKVMSFMTKPLKGGATVGGTAKFLTAPLRYAVVKPLTKLIGGIRQVPYAIAGRAAPPSAIGQKWDAFKAKAQQKVGSKGVAQTLLKSPFALLKAQLGGVVKVTSKLTGIPMTKFKAAGKAFKSFGGMAKGAAMGGLAAVGMQLLAAFNPLKPLISALTTIVSVWGTILGTALLPVIQKLYDVLLSPQMLDFWNRLAVVVMKLFEALLPVIDILMPFVDIILEMLILALEALVPLFPLIQMPLELLASLIDQMYPILEIFLIPLQILGYLFKAIAPLLEFFLLPLDLLGGVFELLGVAAKWVGDKFMFLAELIKDGIDWAIGGIMDILDGIFSWINGAIMDVHTFFGGDEATAFQIALLSGEDEVLSPDAANTDLSLNGGLGRATPTELIINIQGYVTEDTVEELANELNAYTDRLQVF